jgi:hypothetical protein
VSESSVTVCPVLDWDLFARLRDSARYPTLWLPVSTHESVAGAWNAGRRATFERNASYLILISEAVIFGPPGGYDFTAELDDERLIVDAQHGWKLIALHRRLLDAVGPFDEGFSPAYFEDSDYLYRAHLAGLCSPLYNDRPGRHQLVVDARVPEGDGHAVQAGHPHQMGNMRQRYLHKWGGPPGAETYTEPQLPTQASE